MMGNGDPAEEMLTVSGKAFRGTTDELRGLLGNTGPVEFRGCMFIDCDLPCEGSGGRAVYVGCLFQDTIHREEDCPPAECLSVAGSGSRVRLRESDFPGSPSRGREENGMMSAEITLDEVRERVNAIADILAGKVAAPQGTDSAAHEAEDDLRRDVLIAIAAGTGWQADLAREALRTTDLDFSRWFD